MQLHDAQGALETQTVLTILPHAVWTLQSLPSCDPPVLAGSQLPGIATVVSEVLSTRDFTVMVAPQQPRPCHKPCPRHGPRPSQLHGLLLLLLLLPLLLLLHGRETPVGRGRPSWCPMVPSWWAGGGPRLPSSRLTSGGRNETLTRIAVRCLSAVPYVAPPFTLHS